MGSILSALRFKFPRNTWKSTTASASPNPGSRESPPSSASAEAANVSSTSQKSSPADSPNGAPVKARNIPSVSFSPASHKAEPFPSVREITSLLFLGRTCPEAFEHTKDIIHCSIGSTPDVKPQKNGFVHTVLECYNEHHALTIRPDDVWIAILTQFSFFVGGNAEALRSLFVLHEGKKELTMMVEQEEGKVDWDVVVQMVVETMNRKIQENVIDPELRQWIIPAFSTTTANDRLVAGIVMMATLKEFFLYKASSLCCGIPRVTLEGERDDWVYLLNRIDKLKEFGPQTTNWYHLLRPILSRFVKAFDKPDSRKNLEFWRKVAHFESDGSGPTWLSGWITAFMTFNAKGRWQGGNQHNRVGNALVLDGVRYPRLDSSKVPRGTAQVNVTLKMGRKDCPTALIAGSMGTEIFSSGDKSLSGDGKRDSARPAIGWWWVLKKEKKPTIYRDVTHSTSNIAIT